MRNLKLNLKRHNKSFRLCSKNLRWQKNLLRFMFLLILLLPAISYCQYPKQTIINGDTVVIMLRTQADEMNQTFLEQNSQIDSLRSNIDTIESLYVQKVIQSDADSLVIINQQSSLKHEQNKNKTVRTVFDTIALSFLVVTFVVSVILTNQ